MPLKNGRTTASLQTTLIGSVIPAGSVAPFSGSVIPDGWLLCDGSAISRTLYPNLFSALGTTHGQGDGSTTFNLPDYQGMFLRGRVVVSNSITGSGTAATNQATFSNHGIRRTGFRIRLASGTLTGLAVSTDYFAIVVDSNTLAFATTLANAISNTRVVISGTNSAVLTQYEDPGAATRAAITNGGATGAAVGSLQQGETGDHTHNSTPFADTGWPSGSGDRTGQYYFMSPVRGTNYQLPILGNGGSETRPKNVAVNYIIKF